MPTRQSLSIASVALMDRDIDMNAPLPKLSTETRALDANHEREQLRQIMAGLSDGIMVYERDGTLAWVNAKALAMHGDAETRQLGETVAAYAERYELRYRNGHRLAAAEYPANRAIAGETLENVVVEVGLRGESPYWAHKVNSILLTTQTGEPDRIVLVLDDFAEAMDAEQRFERMFSANPAPAVICRLSDLRFVKVNTGFLEMTGHRREDVIGRSIYDIDVLERAERREMAIRHLEAAKQIPQMEAELNVAGGGTKLVIVAGHPIEIGKQSCMLFSFADLEHRRRSETALRQSEERFAQAFRLSPVPMLISTLKERRIIDTNEAFTREFGHSATEAIGRSKVDLKIWADVEARVAVERQLHETGRIETTEVRLHNKKGDVLQCLLSSEGVTILDERCVLTVIQNVSAQRRSEVQLQAAVEAVMQDTAWLGQKIVAKINSYSDTGPPREDVEALSRREREVLAMITQGAADKAIARELKLSVNTVKNHVRRIYRKTNCRKRAEAVVWGRQRGILNHVAERNSPS